jgi:hypothetical protein
LREGAKGSWAAAVGSRGENDHTGTRIGGGRAGRVRRFEESGRPWRISHVGTVYGDFRSLGKTARIVLSWFRGGPLPFGHS